jgi:hypothetical protein
MEWTGLGDGIDARTRNDLCRTWASNLGLPDEQGLFGLMGERLLRFGCLQGHDAAVLGSGPNWFTGEVDGGIAYRVDGQPWEDTKRLARIQPGSDPRIPAGADLIHERHRDRVRVGLVFGGLEAAAVAVEMHRQLVEAGQWPYRPLLVTASPRPTLPPDLREDDVLTVFARRGADLEQIEADAPCAVLVLDPPGACDTWLEAVAGGYTENFPCAPRGADAEIEDPRDVRESITKPTNQTALALGTRGPIEEVYYGQEDRKGRHAQRET